MKRLNQIIKEHVDLKILEQQADQVNFTKLQPAPKNIYLSTVNPDAVSYTKWPSSVKPPKWSNTLAEMFLRTNLKAVAFRPPTDDSDAELAQKKLTPILAWNFAKETLLFKSDGTVHLTALNKDLYWSYVPTGYTPIPKLSGQVSPELSKPGIPQVAGQVNPELSKPGTGHMMLYTDRNHKTPAAVILIEKNGQANFRYTKFAKQRTAEEEAKAKIAFWRNVLDLVGVVPIIGDAADLYQSMWYLSDWKESGYKNTDDLIMSILSMIAVIPIVGSFAKLGIKKIMPKRGYTNFKSWFEALTQDRALTDAAKIYYARLMIVLSNSFTSIKTKISGAVKKVGGFEDFDEVIAAFEKQINYASQTANEYLYNLEKRYGIATGTLSQSEKALKNADIGQQELKLLAKKQLIDKNTLAYKILRSDKRIANLIYGYGKTVNAKEFIDGVFRVIPGSKWKERASDILRIFSDATIHAMRYGKQRREVIVQGIMNTFKKTIKSDKDAFGLMLYHAIKSPGPKVRDIINRVTKISTDSSFNASLFRRRVKFIDVPVDIPNRLTKKKGSGYTKSIERKLTSSLTDKELIDAIEAGAKYTYDETSSVMPDIMSWLRGLSESDYNGIVNDVLPEFIAEQNPLWKEVLIDPLNAAKAYFPKSLPEFASHFKANFKTIQKYLNDLYEAAGEFREDLGFKEKDQISTSTGYEIIRKLINNIPIEDDNTLKQAFNTAKARNLQALQDLNALSGMQNRTTTPDLRIPGYHPDSTYVPPVGSGNIRSTTNISDRPFTPVPIRPGASATRR